MVFKSDVARGGPLVPCVSLLACFPLPSTCTELAFGGDVKIQGWVLLHRQVCVTLRNSWIWPGVSFLTVSFFGCLVVLFNFFKIYFLFLGTLASALVFPF